MTSLRRVQQEALARRMAGQPEAVRVLLEQRLCEPSTPVQVQPVPPRRAPGPTGLAGLTTQLRQHAPRELASVGRFRRAWASTRAEERVLQASTKAPVNAGPLNSQMLVLQSLGLMRALPGGYLRRFVGHVEALLWLEAAAAHANPRKKPRR